MPQAERRRCPRFPVAFRGVAATGSVYHEVTVLNISMHGAQIKTRGATDVPASALCSLTIGPARTQLRGLSEGLGGHNDVYLVGLAWNMLASEGPNLLRRLIWESAGIIQGRLLPAAPIVMRQGSFCAISVYCRNVAALYATPCSAQFARPEESAPKNNLTDRIQR